MQDRRLTKNSSHDLASLREAADVLFRARNENPAAANVGRLIREWIDGGARDQLDKVLGLKRKGGKSARHSLALEKRDRVLRAVYKKLYVDLPPSAAARKMAIELGRYHAVRWSREKAGVTPPPDYPASQWWTILQVGARTLSVRQLIRVLRDIQ